jgi:hypothetical protein
MSTQNWQGTFGKDIILNNTNQKTKEKQKALLENDYFLSYNHLLDCDFVF